MALNFPASPSLNQTYEYNGRTFIWNGTSWASTRAGDGMFYENKTTVTADYTITTGMNAMSAGPVTVGSGVTVTVPSGSTWTIV